MTIFYIIRKKWLGSPKHVIIDIIQPLGRPECLNLFMLEGDVLDHWCIGLGAVTLQRHLLR